jgi:nickel/cobalt transporter (NicO) family protein
MRRSARAWGAGLLAVIAVAASAGTAAAHPLGNYTVNRGVEVTIGSEAVNVRYVIDMAEIPAFSEIQVIDANGDGVTDASELRAYAASACSTIRSALDPRVDGSAVQLVGQGAPQLSFPPGAGGLSTLRLVCEFTAPFRQDSGTRHFDVADTTDDGHVGWREVTIAAGSGVRLTASDAPSVSASAQLTKYPMNALQTPPNIRSGAASFRLVAGAAGQAVADPSAPTRRGTADDPLAALIGGDLTPLAMAGALLLALALGAAHAISPGHGKTLVAAYLIGSRGSMRHAATLGFTVAATHTAGVFVLGAATLLIGQFLVPERVIEWLSIGSGTVVVVLGAGLVVRALRSGRPSPEHAHGHPHSHEHSHPHPHGHASGELRRRNVVALGLAGGMVPSASALIVLLVAITTGRLLFGMVLIVAFGAGMAIVLGGLAVVTTVVRASVRTPSAISSHPLARSFVRRIPLVSGLAVTIAGLAVTIGAFARFA